MGRWKGAAALLATSAVLAGCGVGTPGSGLTATRTSTQTGKACPTTRRASGTLLSTTGRTLWRAVLRPDQISSAVPVSSGATVFADTGGQITALSSTSGRRLWRRSLGTSIYDEWLTPSGLVVNVDQVGPHAQVVDLDPTSGRTLWTYRPGGEGLYGNPIVSGDSLVAVADRPNRLVVVETGTGRVRWSRRINVASQPVAGAGIAAIDPAGTLHGYSLRTGHQMWRVGRTDTAAALALDQGTVVVESQISPDPTALAGYAITDGHRRWKLGLKVDDGAITTTEAGLVLALAPPTGTGGLVLINAVTGRVEWKDTASRRTWQIDPVIAGSDLATIRGAAGAGATSHLQYRGLATGRLVVDRVLPRHVFVATITGDGPKSVLLTGDGREGVVQSYRGGRLAWTAHLPEFAADPVIRVRGHGLFVQSEDPGCAVATGRGKG